ncbi:hypothetical protein P3W55_01855 [Pseudomonas citronellolis]|uniref:Uncharacterized protein n=1 Tax=Pseudomonas citronellolis TaxID=53408 RepID=A0AAW6NYZ1_9PSED|nr:hypothetical protein [Pseudomonas citronellolis]MDF3840450.1 hypothetical protein [Pseudomonas citronellolis]WRT82978.1 hypothetical protein VK748_00640 [Pseudomonas citronellolis]
MRHGKDDRTLNIEFDVPQPVAVSSCDFRVQVSEIVSEILDGAKLAAGLQRCDIAAQMSRASGEDISKHMLDAWSSPARVDHNLPFYRAALLEQVCGTHRLTDLLVEIRGGRVAYGRDALLAELGRQERIREEATRKARELRRHLGGGA